MRKEIFGGNLHQAKTMETLKKRREQFVASKCVKVLLTLFLLRADGNRALSSDGNSASDADKPS